MTHLRWLWRGPMLAAPQGVMVLRPHLPENHPSCFAANVSIPSGMQ